MPLYTGFNCANCGYEITLNEMDNPNGYCNACLNTVYFIGDQHCTCGECNIAGG